jgi:phosphate transport system permease protein
MEQIAAMNAAAPMINIERQRYTRRRIINTFMTGLITSLTFIAVGILALILVLIVANGIGAVNIDLFIKEAPDGGIGHAILGTLEMLGVAALMAVPIGIATAIYLSEYGEGWISEMVRSALDLLAQLPSIVVGLFVWALIIRSGVTQRSGIAGAIALAIIMLPIVARTTEEILRLVPDHLREAGLALGTPRWKVIIGVVVPTVLPGIITGIILSMARAAGETAPLLLTALGSQYFEFDLSRPMAAIPLQLYNDAVYSIEPEIHARAWAAGLILIVVVAIFSATVRFLTGRMRYES